MTQQEAFKYCRICGQKTEPFEDVAVRCTVCGAMQWFTPIVGNSIILENDQGEVLLVKRTLNPGKGTWDTPGGFLNAFESFEDSLIREGEEELGITIAMESILGVYTVSYEYQDVTLPNVVIVAICKRVTGKMKTGGDADAYKYVKKEDLLKEDVYFPYLKDVFRDYLALRG